MPDGSMLYYCAYQHTMHMCTQGYDMEDAMILNKASVERGLVHASVYKSEVHVCKRATGNMQPPLFIDKIRVCIDFLYVFIRVVDRFEQEEQ